jgi:hypothetical protein
MKSSLIVAAVVAMLAGVSAVSAAELPSYEAAGLPISPVQVGALGASHVQERTQAPAEFSPHQLKVLRPHVKKTAEAGAR